MKSLFFIAAFLLFVMTIYHVRLLAMAGVYPSKFILKRRAAFLAVSCLLFLLASLMIKV